MDERQENALAGLSTPAPDAARQSATFECPPSARGCDITCGSCAELWNLDMLLRGETEPALDWRDVVRLLLGMGCPECAWGTRAGRREECKTLHVRSLLAYFLALEPAEGPARLELLSWVLHDITNFVREQAGLEPIALEGED